MRSFNAHGELAGFDSPALLFFAVCFIDNSNRPDFTYIPPCISLYVSPGN